MKLAITLCCIICLLSAGQVKSSSNQDAQVLISHLLGIVSDSISLADNNNNQEAPVQTGVSILGHLGSIISHIAQSRRDQLSQPVTADEVVVFLMNNQELAQQIGSALFQSKHLIKSPVKSAVKAEL